MNMSRWDPNALSVASDDESDQLETMNAESDRPTPNGSLPNGTHLPTGKADVGLHEEWNTTRFDTSKCKQLSADAKRMKASYEAHKTSGNGSPCSNTIVNLTSLTLGFASDLLHEARVCGILPDGKDPVPDGTNKLDGRRLKGKTIKTSKAVKGFGQGAFGTELSRVFTPTAWDFLQNTKDAGAPGMFANGKKHLSNKHFALTEFDRACVHAESKTSSYLCATQKPEHGATSATALVIGGDAHDEMINFWKNGSVLKWFVTSFPSDYGAYAEAGMRAAADAWNMVGPGGVQFSQVWSVDEANFNVVYRPGKDDGLIAMAFFPASYLAGKDSYHNNVFIYDAAFTTHSDVLANVLCHELGHVLGLRHSFALEMERTDENGSPTQAGLYGKPDDQSVMSYQYPPHIDYYDVRDIRPVYKKFEDGQRGLLDIGNGEKHEFTVRRVDIDVGTQ